MLDGKSIASVKLSASGYGGYNSPPGLPKSTRAGIVYWLCPWEASVPTWALDATLSLSRDFTSWDEPFLLSVSLPHSGQCKHALGAVVLNRGDTLESLGKL